MSRCGCTSPCPACPQSTYYDEAPEGLPSTNVTIPAGSVLTTVISRVISVPAALPGIGAVVRVTISALNTSGGTNDCFFEVRVDSTVLRQHTFNIAGGGFTSEGGLQTAVQNLSPGSHTFFLNVLSEFGLGVVAEMTIELIRSDNLVVN